jgi:hypothetical protein
MSILENMWLEAQSVSTGPNGEYLHSRPNGWAYAAPSEVLTPPFKVPPQDDGPSTKTIRFSRYLFHNTVSIGKERNGEEVSSGKERKGEEVSSGASVPLERTSSGGASAGSFPHPFGPDPLFEDGGATEEFGEAAGGQSREKGSRGKDCVPDIAWNKTKEGGRKYISCHYVLTHVQVPVLVEGRKGCVGTCMGGG